MAERTPLYDVAARAGAVFAEDAGWLVPAHFGDAGGEYERARAGAGLWDVSPGGKVELTGPEAAPFLHNLCTNDLKELALVLVEYGAGDPQKGRAIRAAYADAGGPGRVERPTDFAMPIAQLSHIVVAGCRRWLGSASEADRADNEAWVREFIDRPVTRTVIEALLSG